VRLKAGDVLLRFSDHEDVGNVLLDQLNLALRNGGQMEDAAYFQIKAAAARASPAVNGRPHPHPDALLRAPHANFPLIIRLIDDLGTQGDPQAVEILNVLSRARFFESSFPYCRSIVQALAKCLNPEAISALIELMSRLKGLVQNDVIQHLT